MSLAIGLLFGISSMLGYGICNYLLAVASRRIGALKTALWYQFIGLAVLMILAVFLLNYNGMSAPTLGLAALAGLIGIVSIVSYSKGMEVGSVPVVATVASTYGAVAALLGFLLLQEALSPLQALCICMVVAGTVAVSFRPTRSRSGGRKTRLGLNYALVAMFGWAAWVFFMSLLVRSIGWFSAALFPFVFGVIFMLLYSGMSRMDVGIKPSILPLISAIAVLEIIGFLSYNLGVTYSYVDIIAPIVAASPAVTVLLSLLFMREKLYLNQEFGVLLVISGLVLLAVA